MQSYVNMTNIGKSPRTIQVVLRIYILASLSQRFASISCPARAIRDRCFLVAINGQCKRTALSLQEALLDVGGGN